MLPEKFEPNYAIPPGETLAEALDALGMTQRELSVRTGLSERTISWIRTGKAPVTAETALLFERALGVPARLWMALEAQYREDLARLGNEPDAGR